MAEPDQPVNPRVCYPDGTTIPIRALSYETTIEITHYWVSQDPEFVPWVPGVCTAYDPRSAFDHHQIIVGFDYRNAKPDVKGLNVQPIDLTADQLGDLLADMAARVRCGDSFEGNISYTFSETDPHAYAVQGVYRLGNQFGQGSVRMIGDPTKPTTEVLVLHTRTGQPITSVTVAVERPRIDALAWAGRLFLWSREHEQYREATVHEIAGD